MNPILTNCRMLQTPWNANNNTQKWSSQLARVTVVLETEKPVNQPVASGMNTRTVQPNAEQHHVYKDLYTGAYAEKRPTEAN